MTAQSRIIVTTEVRGLRSGDTTLSDAEQRQEAAIRSVVINQPHRRGSDDVLDESALGRFVKRWHRNEGDRRDRFYAGCMYAETVDLERVACGFPARQPAVPKYFEESVEEALKRKEEAKVRLADANGCMRILNTKAPGIIYRLAYDGQEIRANEEDLARNALYRLCIHFQVIKRGYHAT